MTQNMQNRDEMQGITPLSALLVVVHSRYLRSCMSGMLRSKSQRQVSSGAGRIATVPGGASAIGEKAMTEPVMKRGLLQQHESNTKKHQTHPEQSKLSPPDVYASQKRGHSV